MQGVLPLTSDRLSNFDRVKVDAGQTSFFEGREFRMYKRLSMSAGTTYVMKVVVPGDAILYAMSLEATSGEVTMLTMLDGTPPRWQLR